MATEGEFTNILDCPSNRCLLESALSLLQYLTYFLFVIFKIVLLLGKDWAMKMSLSLVQEHTFESIICIIKNQTGCS